MSIKTTDTDKGARRILRDIKVMHRSFITAGVHESAGSYQSGVPVGAVAFWAEYGTVNQPARPWMSTTIDTKRDSLLEDNKRLFGLVIDGKLTPEQALKRLGFRIEEEMKRTLQSDVPPPNAPSTLARKSGTKTLIDSRLLLRSIGHEVHMGGVE